MVLHEVRKEALCLFIHSRIENTRLIYHAEHLKINLVYFRVFIGV